MRRVRKLREVCTVDAYQRPTYSLVLNMLQDYQEYITECYKTCSQEFHVSYKHPITGSTYFAQDKNVIVVSRKVAEHIDKVEMELFIKEQEESCNE